MDIKIKSEEGSFKYRVAGVLWKNNKMLLQTKDNGFFALPGGHVHLGESAERAVEREMREELKVETEVTSPLAVIENFFNNELGLVTHEICFYYNMRLKDETSLTGEDYVVFDEEDGKLDFRWYSSDELKNVDFRPKEFKQKLLEKPQSFFKMTIDQTKK